MFSCVRFYTHCPPGGGHGSPACVSIHIALLAEGRRSITERTVLLCLLLYNIGL